MLLSPIHPSHHQPNSALPTPLVICLLVLVQNQLSQPRSEDLFAHQFFNNQSPNHQIFFFLWPLWRIYYDIHSYTGLPILAMSVSCLYTLVLYCLPCLQSRFLLFLCSQLLSFSPILSNTLVLLSTSFLLALSTFKFNTKAYSLLCSQFYWWFSMICILLWWVQRSSMGNYVALWMG